MGAKFQLTLHRTFLQLTDCLFADRRQEIVLCSGFQPQQFLILTQKPQSGFATWSVSLKSSPVIMNLWCSVSWDSGAIRQSDCASRSEVHFPPLSSGQMSCECWVQCNGAGELRLLSSKGKGRIGAVLGGGRHYDSFVLFFWDDSFVLFPIRF